MASTILALGLGESPVHSAKADMREVLDPLEVGDRNSTGIEIGIRNYESFFLTKDFVRLIGQGAIGGCSYDVYDPRRIFMINHPSIAAGSSSQGCSSSSFPP